MKETLRLTSHRSDFGVQFGKLTDRAVPELAEGQSNAELTAEAFSPPHP